jgi:hypothetical protein
MERRTLWQSSQDSMVQPAGSFSACVPRLQATDVCFGFTRAAKCASSCSSDLTFFRLAVFCAAGCGVLSVSAAIDLGADLRPKENCVFLSRAPCGAWPFLEGALIPGKATGRKTDDASVFARQMAELGKPDG